MNFIQTIPVNRIRYAVDKSGRIYPLNYKGQPCTNCKCANCNKRALCFGNGLLGNGAGAAHKITVTPQNATYAMAWVNFKENLKVRTAGGSYIGDGDLVETVKQIGLMPLEVAKEVLKYTTTPGIAYEVYQAGKQTYQQIDNRMKTDPVFKQKVQNITKSITSTGKDIIETVTGPIVATSKLITWMPYIVIGVLAILAYGVASGGVETPKKVSVF